MAVFAAPLTAAAQNDGVRGAWSLTFSGGAALPTGGEFHEGGQGTVLGLATNVQSKSNSDVFDPGFGWRAGVGYGVTADGPLNVYLSALGGFRRVEAIAGTFSVPAAGVTLTDVPFFADSTVPVVGGDLGALFAVSPRVRVGIEGGVRYHGDLSEIEGLAGAGPRAGPCSLRAFSARCCALRLALVGLASLAALHVV